jgi:RHS repeat-associated protein
VGLNPLGTFTYDHPNAVSTLISALTSTGGPGTTFSYLDAAHDQRLGQIWHKDAGAQTISKFDYEYDVVGQIKKWTQQAGAAGAQAFDLGYDSIGQLKSATLKDASQVIVKNDSYDYDAGGNRSLEAIDSLVTGETPNSLNQLKTRQGGTGQLPIRGTTTESPSSVTVNGNTAIVKGYNTFEGKPAVTASNNTVAVVATDVNGNPTTKSYNVVVTGSGTKTLVYDANGNLTGDGTRAFEWDPLDRLTAVTSGTHRSEFAYNGVGQRVTVVEKDNGTVTNTKNLISIGSEICEERDASNSVTKRYYAQGMQLGPISYYYSRDHLGSIRELTDSSGAVQARYDYDVYGRRAKLSGSLDADFGFTGHYYHQPSGLHHALYRAYDADLGRWLNRDPIGEKEGINLYGYVGNNPIYWTDPLGLFYAERYAGYGAAAGFGLTLGGSIVVDAATGGLNILATPLELAGGTALGGAVGYGLGSLLDLLTGKGPQVPQGPPICQSRAGAGSDLPTRGTPNSSDSAEDGKGGGTIRGYGPNGRQ